MSPSDISKGRVESPLPAESRASGPVDDPRGRNREQIPVVSIINDGLMNVCLVLDQHGNGTGSVESEPVYSSDAIDRGEFGATYHPVTGQKLKGLGLAFDNEHRCWRFEQPVTGGYGWGEEIPPDVKKLPRIGDSIAHPKSGFPLPRWNFDPYTGEKLRQ